MTTSIKITELANIGSNIAITTLVPVVNMTGTPQTEKATLQLVGNLILEGAGGSSFSAAAKATTAGTVTTAAQPNITSVGTLTSLAVTGNVAAGNVSGATVVGSSLLKATPTTVGSLVAAATAGAGARSFVTDGNLVAASNFGAAIGSGGSNTVPVYSDGTVWRIG